MKLARIGKYVKSAKLLYGFIAQEVKQTAFRLDGIAEPPADRPDAPRGYVEFQFQPARLRSQNCCINISEIV